MKKFGAFFVGVGFLVSVLTSMTLSGCAAALLAGGAVGGYAIAKDMEDGKLIDTPEKKKKSGNKGWFGGGDSDED